MALVALTMSAGCYESDFPLDPAPRAEVDQALLGTWRCLPFNSDADESPATLRVRRRADRRYDVTWQEGAKQPDRYEGFTSTVRGAPFVNIRELKADGKTGQWVFVRPTLLREANPTGPDQLPPPHEAVPDVLRLRVVDDKAMKGVEASPRAVRRAIEQKLSNPALTVAFCVCVRATEPTELTAGR